MYLVAVISHCLVGFNIIVKFLNFITKNVS